MRLTLGASRFCLVQQLLTESLLLMVLSGGIGLLLHLWLTGPIRGIRTPLFDTSELQLSPDFALFAQAALLSIAATLICGLVPALQSTRPQLLPAIKGLPAHGRSRRLSMRNVIVAGQVAASAMLLMGGSLFMRSLLNMGSADPGFDADRMLAMAVKPVRGRHTPQQERIVRPSLLPGR